MSEHLVLPGSASSSARVLRNLERAGKLGMIGGVPHAIVRAPGGGQEITLPLAIQPASAEALQRAQAKRARKDARRAQLASKASRP